MLEITGNLWDYFGKEGYICCIPTNGVVNKLGKNIMGAGLAKEANQRLSNSSFKLDEAVGKLINKKGNHVVGVKIGDNKIIMFPTKDHFKNPSSISLICRSCRELKEKLPKGHQAVLPRIGCGMGGLDWTMVKASIQSILDTDDFIIVSNEKE